MAWENLALRANEWDMAVPSRGKQVAHGSPWSAGVTQKGKVSSEQHMGGPEGGVIVP